MGCVNETSVKRGGSGASAGGVVGCETSVIDEFKCVKRKVSRIGRGVFGVGVSGMRREVIKVVGV